MQHTMTRRAMQRFLATPGVLLSPAALAATGCSIGAQPPKSTGEAQGSLFWYRLQNPVHTPYFDQQLAGFQAKYPKVQIVAEESSGAAWNAKYVTMAATDTAPDVFWLQQSNNTNAGNSVEFWASRGLILDFEPHFARGTLKRDDYLPGALDHFKYEQKVWGTPFEIFQIIMYVNTTLLRRSGVEPPKPTWTYQDALRIAQQVQRGSGPEAEQYGWDARSWQAHVVQYGGKLADATGSTMPLNTPQTIAAIQFLQDLFQRHRAGPRGEGMGEFTDFARGKVALFYHGNYQFDVYKKVNFDWMATTYPAGPGPAGANRAGHQGVNVWSVSKASKNPDAAVALATYLGYGEGADAWVSSGRVSPLKRFEVPYYTKIQDLSPAQAEQYRQVLNMTFENIKNKQIFGWPTFKNGKSWNDVSGAAGKEITLALDGQRSAQDSVKAAEQAANAIIAG